MLKEGEQGQTTEYSLPCVLILGGFDGLHIGHKRLLDYAKSCGLAVGITAIEGGKGKNLFTAFERQKIFNAFQLDFSQTFSFTEEFKNTSKEDFLTFLTQKFNVKSFVCGKDFRFGKGAQGTPEFIWEFTGIPVHAMDVLTVHGEKVSTSSIKEYLQSGNVEKANRLLLQPFFLSGTVKEGRKVGRTIGFPTANLNYPFDKFPMKEGVYAVHAQLYGKTYKGIANFGTCPTFGVCERKLEVYFDDFDGDVYGRELDVYFDGYLRDIKKFKDIDGLKMQLQEDLQRLKTRFTEGKR